MKTTILNFAVGFSFSMWLSAQFGLNLFNWQWWVIIVIFATVWAFFLAGIKYCIKS